MLVKEAVNEHKLTISNKISHKNQLFLKEKRKVTEQGAYPPFFGAFSLFSSCIHHSDNLCSLSKYESAMKSNHKQQQQQQS